MPSETYLLPASIVQRHLVAEAPYLPVPELHHLALALRLEGGLDPAALERALVRLSAHHEALRTAFQAGEEGVRQAVSREASLDWGLEDLSAASQPEADLAQRMRDAFRAPFDLAVPPLFRTRLYRLAEGIHVILLVAHAGISDCASLRILARDLLALLAGRELPPLPFQFVDFAAWQDERLAASPELLEAWRACLANEPRPLLLPPDRPRKAARAFRQATLSLALSADLWTSLQELARRERATPFMVLAAGFLLLLARTAGSAELVVGVPVSGRSLAEVAQVVGPFGNTLPLRIQVEEAEPVRHLLGRVREVWLDALSRQDLPVERLLEALPLRRVPGLPRLFQATFTLLDPEQPMPTPPGLEVRSEPFHGGHGRCELSLSLRDEGGSLGGVLGFDPDLFDTATLEAFLDRLQRLYRGMAEAPDLPAGCLPKPEARDLRRLAVLENGPAAPEGLLHALVERQAAERPESPALLEAGRRLTYGALDRYANQLAQALVQRGVKPGDTLAVMTGPRLELAVALLGILKTGAACLPLDANLPPARLAALLGEIRPTFIVVTRDTVRALPAKTEPWVLLDCDRMSDAQEACPSPDLSLSPEAVALVLHPAVEGSRGLAVSHRRLVQFVTGLPGLELGPSSATLLALPLRLEGAAFELWAPLAHGGRCFLASQGEPLAGALERTAPLGVDTLRLPTDIFHRVVLSVPSLLHLVRQVLLGPDPLHAVVATRARVLQPGLRIVHGFTPPAGGLFACARVVEDDLRADPAWPAVGHPLPGISLRVADPLGEEVPPGLTGELLLGDQGQPGRWARTGLRTRIGRDGGLELTLLPSPPRVVVPERPSPAPTAAPDPANPTQALLLRIWEEVLGLPSVGPRDNFFDLGGTSLQVVQMLTRVEALLCWRPPMSLLFTEATVTGLENAFRRQVEEAPEIPLQCIQAGRAFPPWFFLHGDLFGAGIYCRTLARHLGEARGFHVLHPHGTAGQSVPATVEAMAAEHRRLIQGVQPAGPYLLGGFCNCAVVAFEIAHQLEAAGETVALLAMVAPAIVGERLGTPPPAPEPGPGGLDLMFRLDRDLLRATQAVQAYAPTPVRARTVLLGAEQERDAVARSLPIWRRVLPDGRVRWIPGGHATLMTRHVEALAEALREEAEEALQGGPA